ncbi:V8-like Glu-specific endopeptidase [Cognatiyoonia sediminum]|uniref:V8-like Glu-specific endopeptidase n=2 Tax=Cognatiyoonia sediminum TaxID=1508389 RepID=A0A1M5MPL0_9RHOB|nr:V8-like Glu-specific endopeptidase [Cognatiyoonia sediminum]
MEVAAHYERGLKIATLLTGFLLPTDVFRCIWCLMIKPSILAIALICLFVGPSVVSAQQVTRLTPTQQAPWAAVGQLVKGRIGTQSVCTATLVAPDVILTAAHCVNGAKNETPSGLRQYTFAAGWNKGEAFATRSISEIIVPRSYVPGGEDRLRNLNSDWALVRLSDPITNIEPVPIVPLPGPWETVYFLTYSNAEPDTPYLTSGCAHRTLEEGPLQIACPVSSGNSGAAVFVGQPDNPQIVAVIAAKAQNNAFAVVPGEELLSRIESLQ